MSAWYLWEHLCSLSQFNSLDFTELCFLFLKSTAGHVFIPVIINITNPDGNKNPLVSVKCSSCYRQLMEKKQLSLVHTPLIWSQEQHAKTHSPGRETTQLCRTATEALTKRTEIEKKNNKKIYILVCERNLIR